MSAAGIPPGWYPDPSIPGGVRYWDGAGWTGHTAVPIGSPAPGSVAASHAPAQHVGPYQATRPTVAAPTVAAPAVNPAGPSYPPRTPTPPAPRPPKARRPRRRPPLPAIVTAVTLLVATPLAVVIGISAAHAAAPAPLADLGLSLPGAGSDAAAKRDAAAIALGIEKYYDDTGKPHWQPPTVVLTDGEYLLQPPPLGDSTWSYPPITASAGVSVGGENGFSTATWCVWLEATGGRAKDWQVTQDGITEGTCGLG